MNGKTNQRYVHQLPFAVPAMLCYKNKIAYEISSRFFFKNASSSQFPGLFELCHCVHPPAPDSVYFLKTGKTDEWITNQSESALSQDRPVGRKDHKLNFSDHSMEETAYIVHLVPGSGQHRLLFRV